MDREKNVMTKTTGGPLFDQVIHKFCHDGISLEFYAGFVAGHAEKIWMGAVSASMFRPPAVHTGFAITAVKAMCDVYGLHWMVLETKRGDEIWMFRDLWVKDEIADLGTLEENSPLWHVYRARLTGVPASEIDTTFHERQDS